MKKTYILIILLFSLLAYILIDCITVDATPNLYELTPSDYTSSDILIGFEETEYNIEDFTIYVNSLSNEEEILALGKVIPVNNLYSIEQDAVFYHMGKEYGYYLVKEGECFDLLLINFTYGKYNFSNNQYRIRIDQLLQVSFERILVEENGTSTCHFYKTTGRPEYYIANPRFLTTIENPNELNTGDTGYTKENDSGLIISQSRVNFTGISYADSYDFWQATNSFVIKKFLGDISSFISYIPFIGDIYTLFESSLEYTIYITEAGQETVTEQSNENNIITQQSKTDQLANDKPYSKVMAFSPEEEIVLSNKTGSYVENIVLLNDTNVETRITQLCDFDIVKRNGLFSDIIYVEGSGNPNNSKHTNFSFINSQILFKEDKIINNNQINYYIQPNGEDTFVYTPEYSGQYHIEDLSDSVLVNINGNDINESSFYLNQDQVNNIKFSSSSKQYGVAKLLPNEFQAGSLTLNSGERYIYSYNPTVSSYHRINATGYSIKILNEYFEEIDISYEQIDIYLNQNQNYFIVFINNSNNSITSNVTINQSSFQTIESNQEYTILTNLNQTNIYEFSVTNPSYIDVLLTNVEYADIRIISKSTGLNVDLDYGGNGIIYVCKSKNTLIQGTYYLLVKLESEGEYNFNISLYTGTYQWYIDGNLITNYTVRRGQTYNISVKYNGQDALNRFISISGNYSNQDVTLSSYEDGIYKLNINTEVKMYDDNSSASPEIILTIFNGIFEDASHSITLNVIYEHETIDIIVEQNETTGNFVIGFNKSLIEENEFATLIFKYKYYNTNPGTTYYQKEISNYRHGDVVYLNDLSIPYNSNTLTIILERLCIYEEINGTIQQKGYTYNNLYQTNSSYINVFSSVSKNSNVHFAGGTGTNANPYLISNARHLNNVRYLTSSGIYFKQISNVNINTFTSWEPINNFYGEYNGDSYYVSYLNLNINQNDKDYGLFGVVKGTIINTRVTKVSIQTSLTNDSSADRPHVGTIAGYLYPNAKISNCYAINGTINANVFQLTCGGIVGVNFGTVEYCSSVNLVMNVSGRAGGIVGENGATIKNCTVSSLNLTHYWFDNTFTGGVVGWNTTNGIVNNCVSAGTMTWNSPSSGSNIYPSMGKIIGRNTGSYSGCSSSITPNIDVNNGLLGLYDQGKYCFKVDNGLVGRQG